MEIDDLRIDSHKLIYHVNRVNQWLKGKSICPIYIEIGPCGACNHRCIFCALDYVGYKKRFIDKDVLKKRLKEMAEYGVKSIMYAGEGEPLLHKDFEEIIFYTKEVGIDVAVTTNGVFFNKRLAEKCLAHLSWIRFSINAGTSLTYTKVHCCNASDFDRVIKNLKNAVKIKKEKKYPCTVGVQFLLIPQNYKEVTTLAALLRDVGVDYLIIKPYSQHPMSHHRLNKDFHYRDYFYLNEELKRFSNKDFKIIFRIHTMKKIEEKKKLYKHCLGLSFWAYIDSAGNVWACSAYLENPKFLYGNIYERTFKEICESEKREKIIKFASTKLDTLKCREVCRLDEVNIYLWDLRHPHPHVNFI